LITLPRVYEWPDERESHPALRSSIDQLIDLFKARVPELPANTEHDNPRVIIDVV